LSGDIYDEVNWHTSSDTDEGFKNILNYWCSSCGTTGIFLFEEDELNAHGYSIIEAPDGICVGCALINLKGDEMLEDEDLLDQQKFSVTAGITNGTILTKRDLTEEQIKEFEMLTVFSGRGLGHRARYRIKSLYRSAIGEERYRKLAPPYFVGDRREFSKKNLDEDNTIVKDMNIEKSTYIDTYNDWFLCLYRSLKIHEDFLEEAKQNSQIIRPKRLGYGLFSTYLHKAHEWNQSEPIWVFLKRMNLGNIQFKRRLNTWINPVPEYHVTQIESLSNYPKPANIDYLVSLLKSSGEIELSNEEQKILISESKKLLAKLSTGDIDGTNFLDYLHSNCKFQNSFSSFGEQIHACGLIEALCITKSAKQSLDGTKPNTISGILFPGNHSGWWWKQDLTREALSIYEDFDNYFEFLV